MGCKPSRKFDCYFCKKHCKTYPLGCSMHGGCESCLFTYFIRCISVDTLEISQIPCLYCRTLIPKKLVRYILSKKTIQSPEPCWTQTIESTLRSKQPLVNFQCPICFTPNIPANGYTLKCGDAFCRQCLNMYITDKIRGNDQSSITCPDCKKPLSDQDISLNIEPQVSELYEQNRIKMLSFEYEGEKLIICPFCQEGFTINKNESESRCPCCMKLFCFRCYTYHPKSKCNLVIAIQGVTNCPRCGEGVMKVGGCNFVTCRWKACRGNTHFCFLCGQQLSIAEHGSHYGRHGAFGNTCKGLEARNAIANLK